MYIRIKEIPSLKSSFLPLCIKVTKRNADKIMKIPEITNGKKVVVIG